MSQNRVEGDVIYRVNAQDDIEFVSDSWDVFAIANDGRGVVAEEVLGNSLWDFIADDTTRALYQDILERVRSGRFSTFTFRCDSPECRRRLQMEITGLEHGAVEFRVRTLSLEIRPDQPLLHPDRPLSEKLLRVCGWCKKVDVGGRWVEIEDAMSELRLFDETLLPAVTHGMCGECYEHMQAEVNRQ
jgi:hypothetical protein